MTGETKNSSRPEGGIYEQFAYFLNLAVYPNISHMNELSEIRLGGHINRFKRLESIMVLWREQS